jgi:tetratricopeptide (TPR) repeat protein
MLALLLPVAVLAVGAPAPLPRSTDSRDADALYREADAYAETASRLYRQLQSEPQNLTLEERAELQRKQREALLQAAERYERLARLARKQRATRPSFLAAKCRFNLGQYDKALAIYERLIEQHEGKEEGLDALGGAVSCHAAMGQVSKVRQRLLQIEKALPGVPKEVREPWQAWVKEAAKALGDLADR